MSKIVITKAGIYPCLYHKKLPIWHFCQMTLGKMPHEKIMKSIELYTTKVIPNIKQALKTK